jgi:hypothetical protein
MVLFREMAGRILQILCGKIRSSLGNSGADNHDSTLNCETACYKFVLLLLSAYFAARCNVSATDRTCFLLS